MDVSDVLDQRKLVAEFSSKLYEIENQQREPYLLIVEEADKFVPQNKDSLKEIEEISKRGRKRGLGLLVATQRPSLVNKNVLSQCGNQLIGKLTTENDLKAVDLFFSRTDCYFRACIVPYSEEHLDKIGRQQGIPRKLKEAMLYTNSFIKLINNNIPEVKGAILMMDQLTRSRGDRFDEIVRDRLGSGDNATFKHIGYVDSASERNQSIQICDLLLGSILNDHYPTFTTYKNDIREYVKKKIGVPSLKEDYWGDKTHKQACNLHPKFTIRFWGIPYKYLNL